MSRDFFMMFVALVATASVLCSCTETVPPGYVGMIQEPAGLTGEILNPGQHSCWGRDKINLVAISESSNKETMQIQCSDKLNTKAFDLVIRWAPSVKTGKDFKLILANNGAKMDGIKRGFLLGSDVLYKTYVQELARNVSRTVVSKYKSDEIASNREAIQKAINSNLRKALVGTPIDFKVALVNNLDPPDVITNAVAAAKKRDLQIAEEEAAQKIKLLQAKNRRLLAEEEKLTLTREAEAEAAYMKIIGQSLTPEFLKRRELKVREQEIEAKLAAYKKTGSVTLIDGNVTPLVSTK